MNKLLFVLPLLALLTVGIVYTVSQNEDDNLEATTPTFQQWETCRFNSRIQYNKEPLQVDPWLADVFSDIQACYTYARQFSQTFSEFSPLYYPCIAAADNVSKLYSGFSYTGSSYNASDNCLDFQEVYKRGISQDPLPASYYSCIQDCTPSAQAFPYYYNNVFIPVYVKCGGSQ